MFLYFVFFFHRLVQRKKVKVQQRKHEGSKNPLKTLATNQHLAKQQYTENKSNLLLQRSLETCKFITLCLCWFLRIFLRWLSKLQITIFIYFLTLVKFFSKKKKKLEITIKVIQ